MVKTFICKYCNKEFSRSVYPSSKSTFEFCSPSCRNKARILPDIPCPICGKMFRPVMIDSKKEGKGCVRKRNCSKKCADFALREKPSTNPKTHTNDEVQFLKDHYPSKGADWCADQLGYSKSAIVNLVNRLGIILEKKIYQKRVHGAAQKYMTGSKNPNWHGGITCKEWGENWIKQRRACLKRDKRTCQVCGCPARSVHHIIPRRLFSDHIEDSNVLSNLVTLCRKHHLLVEIGKVKLPFRN